MNSLNDVLLIKPGGAEKACLPVSRDTLNPGTQYLNIIKCCVPRIFKNNFTEKIKLTKEEQWIEDHLEEFVPIRGPEYDFIVASLERKKKEMVLNMRINRDDLATIKQKAQKAGIKYQSLISEILHRFAKA